MYNGRKTFVIFGIVPYSIFLALGFKQGEKSMRWWWKGRAWGHDRAEVVCVRFDLRDP